MKGHFQARPGRLKSGIAGLSRREIGYLLPEQPPVGEGGVRYAPGDAYAQTRRCYVIIQKALEEFGETMRAVVRTRMYVTDISQWKEYGRAHREVFSQHPPATTMVEVRSLIQPDMLIEIEVDAISKNNAEIG